MSLDGRYVAHVSIREGKQSLWLRQIATTSNVEVVPAEEAAPEDGAESPKSDGGLQGKEPGAQPPAVTPEPPSPDAAEPKPLEPAPKGDTTEL